MTHNHSETCASYGSVHRVSTEEEVADRRRALRQQTNNVMLQRRYTAEALCWWIVCIAVVCSFVACVAMLVM